MNGRELADRIGVTYRQVDHWTTLRYLRANDPNPGHGNRRHYPPREVRVAETMGALVNNGVDPANAARIARRLARHGAANLGPHLTLTHSGGAAA